MSYIIQEFSNLDLDALGFDALLDLEEQLFAQATDCHQEGLHEDARQYRECLAEVVARMELLEEGAGPDR